MRVYNTENHALALNPIESMFHDKYESTVRDYFIVQTDASVVQ